MDELQSLKNRVEQLENIILKFNFQDSAVFDKKIVSKDMLVAYKHGIKLVNPNGLTWAEIRHGSQINDAGIKAEIGYTSPNGSHYLSSASAQPFFVMVGTTWTLLNIP